MTDNLKDQKEAKDANPKGKKEKKKEDDLSL